MKPSPWPLHADGSTPSGFETTTTPFISSISWKFVEKPLRGQRSLVQSRKLLFVGAAAGSAIFVLFAGVLFLTHGLAGRFGNQVLRLLASENDYWGKRNACIDRICRIGDNQTTPSFILWGDSHAAQLFPGLSALQKTMRDSRVF